MKTNKENLSLSGLISAMRDVIHNNGRLCFFDTLVDIGVLVSRQEKNNDFTLYWGVRNNGTVIMDCLEDVETWFSNCKEYQGTYKIVFKNNSYSLENIQ